MRHIIDLKISKVATTQKKLGRFQLFVSCQEKNLQQLKKINYHHYRHRRSSVELESQIFQVKVGLDT